MDREGLGCVACEVVADEAGDLGGDEVRGDADHADRTDREERQGERVVAGEDFEFRREGGAELVHALDAAAGFLDGDDVFEIACEADGRLDGDLDAATAGDAVKNERDFDRLRDGGEVAVEALGAGLVVVGGHEQGGVGTGFFGGLGEVDRLGGGVRAGSGDDLATAGGGFDRDLDDAQVLVVIECRRLAGGSDGDDSRDAAGDLLLDEGLEGGDVELAVAKGRDERGVGSCE